MRLIKYRAWDTTRDIYGAVHRMGFPISETDPDFLGHKGNLSLFNIENDGFWGIWIEKAILEQFTGLQDCRGRDIYEGDILGSVDAHQETVHRGAVSWCEEDAAFEVTPAGSRGQPWKLGDLNPRRWEVIGNIHETPETAKE